MALSAKELVIVLSRVILVANLCFHHRCRHRLRQRHLMGCRDLVRELLVDQQRKWDNYLLQKKLDSGIGTLDSLSSMGIPCRTGLRGVPFEGRGSLMPEPGFAVGNPFLDTVSVTGIRVSTLEGI